MILSSVALGISVIISALKLADWLLHSDPRALVRMGRYLLLAGAVASVPALIALLVFQQWTWAMVLGAAMLAVPVLTNGRVFAPRAMFKRRFRSRFRPMWSGIYPGEPAGDGSSTAPGDARAIDALRGDFGQPPPDAALARRAAIILEDYLVHAGHADLSARIDGRPESEGASGTPGDGMSLEEAYAVLGLEAGAGPAAVRAAHRRLVQMVHPDRGGSNYLAAKINQAKDVLLARAPRAQRMPKAAAKVAPKAAAGKSKSPPKSPPKSAGTSPAPPVAQAGPQGSGEASAQGEGSKAQAAARRAPRSGAARR